MRRPGRVALLTAAAALSVTGVSCAGIATAAVAAPAAVTGEGDLARAQRRVGELERKIGQQQVELDFFRQALRQVKDPRRPSTGPGVTGSTR